MKTFQEFMSLCEASYDADVMSRSQVRRTGEGGRIGAMRKKSEPERRRVRAVGGGRTEPVEYKPRKDIGTQRAASTREQQPQQERGSADVRAAAAAAHRAERIAAARARAAAKKGGGEAAPAATPKPKQAAATASKLLSTKKPKAQAHPDYKPAKPSGISRAERQRITREGQKELEKRVREVEAGKQGKKPSEVQLKHKYHTWG